VHICDICCVGIICFHGILDCIVFLLNEICGKVHFITVIMPVFLLELTRI
jgi:hypothetical protein